ncbi:type IX secretion system outer membrane channel protein PorV [Dysgonomonas mossii]|uniref:Type IX secretion system outer membrane channel protein PorV n=1 Tax=Dysgonomonas mossii TaxID=163665 RepID=A0A4Y9ITG3_9BACT|nr:type IX secretion system outer membrane channel protein PorV [Dysgonomonas mossii]MBF0760119.1 type IX secretion system outer membrane channel protein PorV [Dysgonomonas mossii]TFU91069.1 type IX secretion system outer membrane channel protein PorV [Dysgonomonas mossii]
MKSLLRKILFVNIFALLALGTYAQDDVNPIQTAMPSLNIAPDARAGGMGDAGVATAPDVYSQHWNAAKYAFSPSKVGFGISYTPWLRKIINDIALVYGVGYYKLGNENNQALSASIRYFSIGDVKVVTDLNDFNGVVLSPNELAIDLAYSRKLTETFSGAVTVRYIRADYTGASEETSVGNAFAADISGYNESYIRTGSSESLLSFGFNISNIGTKISTNGDSRNEFLPTNLRLGASLMYPINEVSTISFSADLNKYLVPTPPVKKEGETNDEFSKRMADYRDINPIAGIFKSFGDAPGGFSEEMKEIAWSLGAEYDYNDKFRLRTGYFHENKMKGNRQYLSFGAGFKLSAFQLDVAYLLATAQQNPLDQTLRFSLGFDIDAMKNLFK